MKCKSCKDTGKILLLNSEISCLDCDSKTIYLLDLENGCIGYEDPPSVLPYILRLNDKFVYLSGIDDIFWKVPKDHIGKWLCRWPPDLKYLEDMGGEYSLQLKIIAKNITSIDEAFNTIKDYNK